MKQEQFHKLGLYSSVIGGGVLARLILENIWEAATDRPAPKNPAAKGVSWKDALLWGASAGLLVGVVRTVMRRGYSDLVDKSPEELGDS